MEIKIENVDKTDYLSLISIWEESVRATHEFLSEEDISFLKPLILEQYFDAVDLRCAKNERGEIVGFIGVAGKSIEMLFVSPSFMRKRVGSKLVDYAIEHQSTTKVDVNEQNPQALVFYENLGFSVVGRSPLDGQGKPFPLLHMELKR